MRDCTEKQLSMVKIIISLRRRRDFFQYEGLISVRNTYFTTVRVNSPTKIVKNPFENTIISKRIFVVDFVVNKYTTKFRSEFRISPTSKFRSGHYEKSMLPGRLGGSE